MKQNKLSPQTNIDLGLGGLGLGGLLSGFGGMAFERVANSKEKNFTLDTSLAGDTGYFETAIETERYNNGAWVILDECETKEQAVKMHEKWLKLFKKNFPKKLRDIHSEEIYTL